MADRSATEHPHRELIASASQALAAGAWSDARTCYERALQLGESAEALEGLAFAAWWQDDVEAAIRARERAYVIRREHDQTVEAARVAGFLAWDWGAMRGANAVANGWLQRARSLTAALPPSAEQAWLPLIEASFSLDTDPGQVLRLSTEAVEHARTHGALDIEMTARTLQGLALVSLGRIEEGTRLLDEGSAAATAGELHDPIAIGSCCCNMVIACERARDYERARQWSERLGAFAERTHQRPLLALCRAHHGAILAAGPQWCDADAELTWAADELSRLRPPLAGFARARLAQLRHRQGRDAEALELLDKARDHVLTPLVRAEIALDGGDAAAALGLIERYLRGLGPEPRIDAAAAHELLVSTCIAGGDLDGAHRAQSALAQIADVVGNDPLRAAERRAAGVLALAEGDPEKAARAFEDAVTFYRRSPIAFELAQTQLALARALAATARDAAALECAREAAAMLDGLGAVPAARTAAKLVTRLGRRSAGATPFGLTAREREILALVADGLSNPAIAGTLIISEHTVHRHIANIFVKLGVSSRAAAVAAAADHELLS